MLAPLEHLEEEIAEAIKKAFKTKVVEYRLLKQKRAVEAVVNKESLVVVVLPTGGRKSLTFMGAACLLQAGVTIVVAPF
jgi:superfamily II DNA helicase RecQ